MRRRLVSLSLTALVVSILASCSFGMDPAWKTDDQKASVSMMIGTPEKGNSSVSGRAVFPGSGYLYLLTKGGPSNSSGPLYGPYSVASGTAFTTNEIPQGTYDSIGVIYTSVSALPTDKFAGLTDEQIIDLFSTDADLLALLASKSSSGVIDNVTLKNGKTTDLSLVLCPLVMDDLTANFSAVSPDLGWTYTISPSEGETRVRRFFSFMNAQSELSSNETVSSLVISGVADNSATINGVYIYDSDGAFLSSLSPVSGTSNTYSFDKPTGENYYMLFDYTTDVSATMDVRVMRKLATTTPTLVVSISDMSDPVINFAGSSSIASNTTLAVTVDGTYDAYRWFYNGTLLTGQTTSSCSFKPSDYPALVRTGENSLMLVVTLGGFDYSVTFPFTIVK